MATDRRASPVAISAFVRIRLLAASLATAALAATYAVAPLVDRGPVLCPLHGLIGLPCPSCGLTRAMARLWSLDLSGALAYNALSVPLFVGLVITPFLALFEIGAGRVRWWHEALHSERVAYVAAGLIIAYHSARLAVWAWNGTLLSDYVLTSWTYGLLQVLGLIRG